MKFYNKFYTDISIAKGPSCKEMFRFSDIVEVQGENWSATEKNISDRTEIMKSKSDTETEHGSVEDPRSMHRTAPIETTVISYIPNIINEENFIAAG